MIALEISTLTSITGFANVEPFIYEVRPGGVVYASYWMDIFLMPDESRAYNIIINAFIRDFTNKYNQVDSLADCRAVEGSFFWSEDQILNVHFEHDYDSWNADYQYGAFSGFCDKEVMYLDDQEYLPILKSSPSVAQSQDIQNYDKLSFISGSAVVSNGSMIVQGKPVGIVDYFINANIYGNDAFLYYYPDNKLDEFGNGDRSNLVRVGSFYVEDYDFTLQKLTFKLQDKRKAGNVSIPTDKFTQTEIQGDVIPLMYGNVRESRAIALNSETTSGDVDYRVALILTILGTVQVDIDGIWTTKTAINVDLPTGTFSLASADGRDSNGSLRSCKVLEPTGIAITNIADIMVDLNERYSGVSFLSSFYNTTEWATEKVGLKNGGVVFDSEIKLYDAIRILQNGSNIGFRYEINTENKRTFRIDDPERVKSFRITPEDIQNRNLMPVKSKSKLVFANIDVKFDKSYDSGRYLFTNNDDFSESVKQNYRELDSLSVETILNNKTDADERALNDATRFSIVPRVMSLILKGEEFLELRILDTGDIEATPDFADADTEVITGRDYFGFIEGKVIGIKPNLKDVTNTIQLEIL